MISIRYAKIQLIQEILKHNINIKSKNAKNQTALKLA